MSYNELSEQEQLRRNSLAALRELGIEPPQNIPSRPRLRK